MTAKIKHGEQMLQEESKQILQRPEPQQPTTVLSADRPPIGDVLILVPIPPSTVETEML